MKLERGALNRLILPSVIALALAGAGAIALWVTNGFLEKTQAAEAAAQADRQAAQAQLGQATVEAREIRDRLRDYQNLVARGVIGDERRLDWVDAIARIKSERKLFDVRYSIDPQRKLELPGLASSPEVEFRASQMRVELLLLHEGDLFTFLDDLRASLGSHVLVRSCGMQRVGVSADDRSVAPRIRAECTIDLVTIRDRALKPS